jgi:hypothetical protein
MNMEVFVNCGLASVTVLDEYAVPVVTFEGVEIIGESVECDRDFDAAFLANPGRDFWSN